MLRAKLIVSMALVLLGTNALTYYITRESSIAETTGKVRGGHIAILREIGSTEHEQVLVNGLELQRQLTKAEIKVGGISSARRNSAVGSCYLPIMMIVTGVLLPFVRSSRHQPIIVSEK